MEQDLLQTLSNPNVAMELSPMVSTLMQIATLLTLVFALFHYFMLLFQPKLENMDFPKLIRREELIAILGAFVLERVGLALTLMNPNFIYVNLLTKMMLMAVFMIASWTMWRRLQMLCQMERDEKE